MKGPGGLPEKNGQNLVAGSGTKWGDAGHRRRRTTVTESAAWLDMDPGIDDAWALVVAATGLPIVGVSAVAGNVGVRRTAQNAREVLNLLDRGSVRVYPGADRPLIYAPLTAESFHGDSGLGPWTPAAPEVPGDAVPVWSHWAGLPPTGPGSAETPMDLIATGPLTNLALGYLTLADFGRHWSSVTVMCGALPGVRAEKHDEFNVYVDPHAADVVFQRGHNVRVVGINVAHKALLPLSDVDRLSDDYGRIGRFLATALRFYGEKSRGEGGDPNAFPVDDVVAVAAVMAPSLFQWAEMPLTVVREGPMRGALLITPKDEDRPLVNIATDIDADGFRDFIWERMKTYHG